MALSLYDISVPVFIRGLGQLSHVLDKGLAHAQSAGTDPTQLVNARLAPDMFTLAGQVQSASDASKLGTTRIAGGSNSVTSGASLRHPSDVARRGRGCRTGECAVGQRRCSAP